MGDKIAIVSERIGQWGDFLDAFSPVVMLTGENYKLSLNDVAKVRKDF